MSARQEGWGALERRVWLALATVYLVWGSSYLGIRVALEGFPPFLLGAGRFILAGVALYAFLRLRGEPAPTAAEWRSAGIVGVLLLVGGNGLVTFAQQWVASGLASVVVATVPLWAGVFSGLSGQWPSRWECAGLLVGFAGVALLQGEQGLRGQPAAAAALVLAAVLWAAGSVWSQRVRLPSGLLGSAAQMIVGGAALLGMSLLGGERLDGPVPVRAWVAAGYLTIFGSLLAFSAYAYLLRRVRPGLATSHAYVNPVVAVTLGGLVMGEAVSLPGLGGIGLTLAGVLLVLMGREVGQERKTRVQATDNRGGVGCYTTRGC